MPKQETILIADDAEINRAVLRSLFEGEYNLLEAENGEQALMLLKQYRETVTAGGRAALPYPGHRHHRRRQRSQQGAGV